jgi:arginyl-tRNA synthetase
MNPKDRIEQKLRAALAALGATPTPSETIGLEVPKDEKMGDFALPCFAWAKSLRRPPPQIAQQLADHLRTELPLDLVSQVQAVGPYVNFTLNKASLAADLLPRVLTGEFLSPLATQQERVMIEYSQPNTHKDFHVGHTRNACLGSSLVEIYRHCGYQVVAANYIGDVGAHIARCLWYLTERYKGPVPDVQRGAFLEKMYVEGSRLLDFYRLTRAPHPGVITARVENIAEHPSEDRFRVLTVHDGNSAHTVVCAGSGFSRGDVVAYAAVGSRVGGRDVAMQNKGGVASDGMICSEAEISMGESRDKICVFPAETPLGREIADVLRHPDVDLDGADSVVELMRSRTEAVRKILRDLESGEPRMTMLWKDTRQWSLEAFDEIYRWMGFKFDHVFFESDVGDAGKDLVKKAYKQGILVLSDGAIGARLEHVSLPFFILLKSDGTGLYSTKDLALAEIKFEKFKIDRSIYVVDAAQSLHFAQVFATLQLLGFKNADKCRHLAYARVDAKDGKMSSRDGNAIYFWQLREQILAKIKTEFLDKYRGEWPDDEIDATAHRIAVATIKYGMLNQDNNKNIAFDLDEWTARTGNSGPYLMYAYARTRSILREAGSYRPPQDGAMLAHASEQALIRKLADFPEVVRRAADRCEPQMLCIYTYDVAKEFSSFYTHCPVLRADSPAVRDARLALVEATGLVIRKALELLGIQTVERM